MAIALSEALREKIISDYLGGNGTQQAIAARHQISAGTVKKVLSEYQDTLAVQAATTDGTALLGRLFAGLVEMRLAQAKMLADPELMRKSLATNDGAASYRALSNDVEHGTLRFLRFAAGAAGNHPPELPAAVGEEGELVRVEIV